MLFEVAFREWSLTVHYQISSNIFKGTEKDKNSSMKLKTNINPIAYVESKKPH